MKNKYLNFILIALLIWLLPLDIEGARGGGGRGGGGSGGGNRGSVTAGRSYQGGRSINRTPSMSRSSQFYNNRSLASQPPNNRSAPQSAATRNQLNQFLQQPKSSNLGRQDNSSNLQNLNRQNLGSNLQNLNRENVGNLQNLRNARTNSLGNLNSRNIQDRLAENRSGYRSWFNNDFFNQHGYNPPYARTAANLWIAATWANAAAWLGTGWSTPIYYDDAYSYYPTDSYGYSDYYPTQSSVLQNQSATATSSAAQNVQQSSQQLPQGDWLPLGVFAVGKDENALSNPTMFLQLALNKNGDLMGTYYNSSTDKTYRADG
ncbi:MAG TPA: hypothetical protein VIH61_09025, partial [Waddliaceae bacterium]